MFRDAVTLGRPFGIRVDVSASWLIIFAVLTWSLGAQYFPSQYPRWSGPFVWAAATFASLLFFACVVLHELAHALVALRYRLPVRQITLFMFGGVAQMGREAPQPRAEFFIALAGPAVSLGLGLLFGLGFFALQPINALASGLCFWLAGVNLSLGLFNLLPGFPLDGGRLLRALVWFAADDYRWANKVAVLVGQFAAMGLISAGVYMLVTQHGGMLNAVWVILVGWFLYAAAVSNYRASLLTDALRDVSVATLMSRDFTRIAPTQDLRELVEDPEQRLPDYFLVCDGDRLVGLAGVDDIRQAAEREPESGTDRSGSAMAAARPVPGSLKLDARDSAAEALQVIVEHDADLVPVTDRGEVCGILTRAALSRYLERRRRNNE